MPPAPPFTGIVLAGGRSRRMGTDKALLAPGADERPMVVRACDALVAAGAVRCVVVAGAPGRVPALAHLGVEAVADDEPDNGPLGGILTGLRAAATPLSVVLTCDLPAVDAATAARLASGLAARPAAEAAMPVLGGRLQVLTAAYRATAAGPLGAAYAAGERSVRRALEGIEVAVLDGFDPAVLADVDLPGDLDQYAPSSRPPGRG